jgi:hypothetical protein
MFSGFPYGLTYTISMVGQHEFTAMSGQSIAARKLCQNRLVKGVREIVCYGFNEVHIVDRKSMR